MEGRQVTLSTLREITITIVTTAVTLVTTNAY